MIASLSLVEKMNVLAVDKHLNITRQTAISRDGKGNFTLTGTHHGTDFKLIVGTVAEWKTAEGRANAVLFFSTNLWKLEYDKRTLLNGKSLKGVVDAFIKTIGISDKKLGFVSTIAKATKAPATAGPKTTSKSSEKQPGSPAARHMVSSEPILVQEEDEDPIEDDDDGEEEDA